MTGKKEKKSKNNYLSNGDNIAVNKRARFDYAIEDTFEAGMQLTGSEVKSMRLGKVSLNESYADEQKGEIFLINANVAEYPSAPNYLQHQPTRLRKLLLNQKEINKIIGSIQRAGYTLVPMRLYFNKRGLVKCELGLGRGKKEHDKRETKKERDWSRQKNRLLRENG
ncbi:MAG: SsrA-binding protein [Micavibrio sp.]|nr:SsrA-binding protein [Micavibrio sp.]HCK33493.1 SsrA-binding protein [Rhodospirillaceae bacterium]